MYEEDNESDVSEKLESKVVDEDADVDESDNIEDWDTEALAVSWKRDVYYWFFKHQVGHISIGMSSNRLIILPLGYKMFFIFNSTANEI